MSLNERLGDQRKRSKESAYQVGGDVNLTLLQQRLHTLVIDTLDMRAMADVDSRQLRDRLRPSIAGVLANDGEASSLQENQRVAIIEALLDEIVGLGPLENFLSDPSISDILVNNAETIFIERGGRLERSEARFHDNTHLLNIIQRIVSRVGRRVDESSPMVDARLSDGSRVNAVVPPIALDGPSLSIRRFGRKPLSAQDLVERGVATPSMMRYLTAAVKSRCNLLVSGGTGAGKTTLLNVLSGFINAEERVITVEDSAELSLGGHHVLRMESRPANLEGKGEVTIRACVRNALRMRPDRIIIGEIRGGEVLDMLQAMNTGHEGSMGTVHANTPRDAVDRLMMMLALSGVTLSTQSMVQFVARSVRIIVQVARALDGSRRITHIAEVDEESTDKISARVIFHFDPTQKRFVYSKNSGMQARFDEHHVPLDLGALT